MPKAIVCITNCQTVSPAQLEIQFNVSTEDGLNFSSVARLAWGTSAAQTVSDIRDAVISRVGFHGGRTLALTDIIVLGAPV